MAEKYRKGFVHDFHAYLFLERSEHDEAEREVIGFILWQLVTAKQGFARPIGSKAYEIVQGKLKGQKGDVKEMNLHHLGATDKTLIEASNYNIFLTEKQTRCEGTTTNTKSGQFTGDLHGSVKGRF